MKVVNQYIIPFAGLKEGVHEFDFEIGNAFFEEYSSLNIKTGSVMASVNLEKKSSFFELEVTMTGNLEIQCDRCLEYFEFPLLFSGELYVKFNESDEAEDEKVIFLHPNDDSLNLEQYFIDCIGLSIPIQKFHPDNESGETSCNSEMLDKIDEHSYKSSSKEESIDPRWSKLNDLLNKENIN